MKSKKLFIYVLIIAFLAIIVLVIGKKKGWFGNEFKTKVAVEKPEKRDLVEVITANGKVQPETEVKISPEVSGEIVELNIKEGDMVKKGDLLIKIRPDNYISVLSGAEAAVNNTKARLKQSQARLEQAKQDFDRNKSLWEKKAISDADFEQISSAYTSALADKEAANFSVESAQAQMKEAQENLRKTSIYAPMSGTVSMLGVELGERVLGTNFMAGTEMLRIADLSRMEVEVEVNENDIVKVHKGDTALIEMDAYLARKFKGLVTEIPVSAMTTGITTDQVTNFNVKISLIPEDYKDLVSERNQYPLRPGMSATADIQTSRKFGVFTIPLQAVTTRPDTLNVAKDTSMVKTDEETTQNKKDELLVAFVAKDGKAIMKTVKTGIQDDMYIEISSGLDLEDDVITAPYSAISKKLKNDSEIEVVDLKDLFKNEKNK
ncbi:MAG: efflux RND transporter periplasmic adaptor subunit [Bacteroidales bacterium]|nr:efflux RND transporter periplasmic adaptor subunit [Bacteroidales bacterium]MCB8998673.1 efflux RND transporter periplasmic adaptor subunit [Bacteroidales bacterium]